MPILQMGIGVVRINLQRRRISFLGLPVISCLLQAIAGLHEDRDIGGIVFQMFRITFRCLSPFTSIAKAIAVRDGICGNGVVEQSHMRKAKIRAASGNDASRWTMLWRLSMGGAPGRSRIGFRSRVAFD